MSIRRPGARVADAQAALEERDGRRLRLDDDLDRPVEQRILVRVEVAVLAVGVLDALSGPRAATRRAPARAGRGTARRSARSPPRSRRRPGARCRREVPSGLKSMSPWPSRLSAPAWSRITRESVWLETANAIRDGNVRLDHPGDHVHRRPLRREHEVDADGARLLREPDDGVLDLLRRDHHQVGELVDHDEQVRQRLLAALAEGAVHLGQVARAHDARCARSGAPSRRRRCASTAAASFGLETTGVSRCGIDS